MRITDEKSLRAAMAQCYSPLMVSAVVVTLPGNYTPPSPPSPPSPTCQRHFDMNKEGTTIAIVPSSSPKDCCTTCGKRRATASGACEAYSWLDGQCYLSNSSSYNKTDPRDLVSGLCIDGACTTAACSTCEGPSTGPTKIRSLVVHVANDHHTTNGSSAAVDSSALKLVLVRFSDGKSMELPLASSQPVQSGSGTVVYSSSVADVLQSSQGLCDSIGDCLALATFRDSPSGVIANREGGLALLANFKELHLRSSNVTLTTSGLTVTLTTDAVTLYATVSSSARGRFDRNGVLLRPGVETKLTFVPWEVSGASFALSLRVEAVNLGSVKTH